MSQENTAKPKLEVEKRARAIIRESLKLLNFTEQGPLKIEEATQSGDIEFCFKRKGSEGNVEIRYFAQPFVESLLGCVDINQLNCSLQ